MTDWSSDPIFGDVALRLAVLGMSSAYHTPSRPMDGLRLEGDPEHYFVDVRRLTLDERQQLGALLDTRSYTVNATRRQREELAERHPWTRAIFLPEHNCDRDVEAPRILGVVNVTPDSFSDGGSWLDPARAIEHGVQLVADGADFLDIGGESTRPGAEPIDAAEELRRVLPVVRGLAERTRVPLSIDTTKSRVARECLAAGASIVNDVSAGRVDPAILDVTARAGAGYIAMHMLGTPRDMQRAPHYERVVREVAEFLRARCRAALDAGVDRAKLWIDPGIGFGKTLEHNLTLLEELNQLRSLGLPLVLGISRKSFIATLEENAGRRRSAPDERVGGSLAALTLGIAHGAEILRVHDVQASKQAALVARAMLLRAPWARCG